MTTFEREVEVDIDEFDQDEVREYVRDNNSVDDVFPDDEIIDYVQKTFDPEDVFPESKLADWANANGWKGPN